MYELNFGLKECSKCEYNVRCQECIYNKKDISRLVAETRDDTVRKYREQLHRAFAHSDSKDKFNKGVFLKAADQIAKEMEESVDEG